MWASDQSRPLADRETFEERFEKFEQKYADKAVPRPPHWSGFIINPQKIEFWMDREFRLHERWLFERNDKCEGNSWPRTMLYP